MADFDLLFIGRGYSISTYMLMAANDILQLQKKSIAESKSRSPHYSGDWVYKSIGIIGGQDSWSSLIRGDGTVNHALSVYSAFAEDRTGSLEKAVTDAKGLGNTNQAAIDIAKNILTSAAPLHDVDNTIEVSDIEGLVINIIKPSDKPYQVTYLSQNDSSSDVIMKSVTANKIIYGPGSGPHQSSYRAATTARGKIAFSNPACMDLDGFMRLTDKKPGDDGYIDFKGKKVAVVGHNAGLDAIVRGLDRVADMTVLISFDKIKPDSKKPTKPFWLSTNHYKTEGIKSEDIQQIVASRTKYYDKTNGRFTVSELDSGSEEKIQISLPKDKKNDNSFYQWDDSSESYTSLKAEDGAVLDSLKVDYFVYATGQDPTAIEVLDKIGEYRMVISPDSKGEFDLPSGEKVSLDQFASSTDGSVAKTYQLIRTGASVPIQSLLPHLRPYYDINQRFSTEKSEIIVGLMDCDRNLGPWQGLEIIGAAVLALSREKSLPSDATAKISGLIKKLCKKGKLVAADQLGVIRAQIESITGFDLLTQIVMNLLPIDTFQHLENKISAKQKITNGFLTDFAKNEKKSVKDILLENPKMTIPQITEYLKEFGDLATFWQDIAISLSPGNVSENYSETCSNFFNVAYETLPKADQEELDKQVMISQEFRLSKVTYANPVDIINIIFRILNNKTSLYHFIRLISIILRCLTNMQAMLIHARISKENGSLDFDFNGADKNQIATLLAFKFPAIPLGTDPDYYGLVEKVIIDHQEYTYAKRPDAAWGYSEDEQKKIWAWLAYYEKNFQELTLYDQVEKSFLKDVFGKEE